MLRKFNPLPVFTLKLSKLSKNVKIFASYANRQNPLKIVHFFWPHITIVPVAIWAEACPFASSSTESLNTAGLKLFVVYIYLKIGWGG